MYFFNCMHCMHIRILQIRQHMWLMPKLNRQLFLMLLPISMHQLSLKILRQYFQQVRTMWICLLSLHKFHLLFSMQNSFSARPLRSLCLPARVLRRYCFDFLCGMFHLFSRLYLMLLFKCVYTLSDWILLTHWRFGMLVMQFELYCMWCLWLHSMLHRVFYFYRCCSHPFDHL